MLQLKFSSVNSVVCTYKEKAMTGMGSVFVRPKGFRLGLFLMVTCVLCSPCTPSRILLVSTQFRSHVQQQFSLGEELAARGHDVYTVLGDGLHFDKTATAMGLKVLNFHIPPDVMHFATKEHVAEINRASFTSAGVESMNRRASYISLADCRYMLEDEQLVSKLNKLAFDIAIVHGFSIGPCSMLLPEHVGIPFIVMSSIIINPWMGVPALPSFVPLEHFEINDRMSFSERLTNAMYFVAYGDTRLLSMVIDYPAVYDTSLLKKYAPAYNSFIHLYSSAKLYIEIKDHHLGFPSPTLPYVIRIPGITQCPAKPLQGKIKAIVDQATDGVVVLSFGTAKMTTPRDIIFKFLDAFSGMNQTIIWKCPDFPTQLERHVPPNVVILPWLPQNDLLGHPNTKVFITHCGNNGQYEAVYHGVPMVGFPLFAEQTHNAQRMIAKGYGIKMDILSFDSIDLQQNILELMKNGSVRQNVAKAGKILKSRKMLPKEEAAYWVEHVLEFGSDHLRSSAQTMPMYKLYMLDIMAFVLGCVTFSATLIICTTRYLLFQLFCRQSEIKINKGKKTD